MASLSNPNIGAPFITCQTLTKGGYVSASEGSGQFGRIRLPTSKAETALGTLFLCLLVDLPAVIEESVASSSNSDTSVGSSGYADDCIAWTTAKDAATAKANLESVSSAITSYMSEHCLVLNNDKTQVLWIGGGNSSNSSSSSVNVGGVMVVPGDTVDVLGVTYDSRLSPAPHLAATLRSARSLACAARRLSLHLRRPILQQVVRALVVGKVGYACAVLRPRLADSDPVQGGVAAVQTAVNDCARAIIGETRSSRTPSTELLQRSGMPSINRLIIEQVAMETWKGMNYVSGDDSTKIPIGQILCPPHARRATRAAASNCIPPPTKVKTDSFLWSAYKIWNSSPTLRSATTLASARRAAKELAAGAPI